MPIYEYQCLPCGHRFESHHGRNEQPVTSCIECGGDVRRVIQPVGIVFKGKGFYATDSKSGRSKHAAADSESGETKKDGKTEPAPESKSEAKSDAKTDTKPDKKSEPKAKS